MSRDPAVGSATGDARLLDLREPAPAAVLPPGVGGAMRRDLVSDRVWAEQYPDDAPLQAALAFIRGRRDDG